MTIPFDGIPLADHREWFEELVALGYTDVWSSEADGTDGFTPLALAAAWTPSLRLGVAIIPAFTRGPAVLAQSVAALAEAAPGRFAMGIGTSSDVIVERWNGIPFVEPYKRARDTVRFLRQALSGEKVDSAFDTFTVKGFRLSRPPAVVPPILVAALRPGMLRLAGREGDGAIINWLSADDVPKVAAEVGPGKEIVARIFVYPSEDADAVRAVGRRMIAAYLNVPVYAVVPRVVGAGTASRGDVVGMEGGGPQGRPGRDTGRGGRRPRPLRLAGRGPGQGAALRGQRGHHDRPRAVHRRPGPAPGHPGRRAATVSRTGPGGRADVSPPPWTRTGPDRAGPARRRRRDATPQPRVGPAPTARAGRDS